MSRNRRTESRKIPEVVHLLFALPLGILEQPSFAKLEMGTSEIVGALCRLRLRFKRRYRNTSNAAQANEPRLIACEELGRMQRLRRYYAEEFVTTASKASGAHFRAFVILP
jgi:hypothetical protein